MRKKVGILEPDHFSKNAIEALEKEFDVELYSGTDINVFLEDKYAIFVRLNYLINDSFLESAKNLRYICSPTTGLNHIRISKGIEIISLKGEEEFLKTIRATPEHTFGLALALLRNYRYAFRDTNNKVWDRDPYRGEEVYGNTVGIIGMGRVGRILAGYYRAFGANVYFYDIKKDIGFMEGVNKTHSLDELLSKTEIVHMCASYSDEYAAYFDRKYFDMLEGKYFINTARGELIDENDLYDYIKKNSFKGVALDVIANETHANGLKEFINISEGKNVIITPHISGATYSSMARTEEFIVSKFMKIIKNNSHEKS